MNVKINMLCALVAIGAIANTHAATLLDTGTPPANATISNALNGSSFFATEFNVGSSYTLDSIFGFINAGGSGVENDTFTIALYSDNSGHVGTQLQSAQATYTADGWNGLASLNWSVGPGNYWAAFEVSPDDSTTGLELPLLAAQNPAVTTAFSDGVRYYNATDMEYGVRVTGTPAVPVPAAAWLFMSSLGCVGGLAQRARRK